MLARINPIYIMLCLLTLFTTVQGHCEEEIIDLTTFIKQRTHQYPLPFGKKIHLYSSPRTGSTLVYNVLRFLFENENPEPFFINNPNNNNVVKSHAVKAIQPDINYVFTIRNPINACLSEYRVRCYDFRKEITPSFLSIAVRNNINFAKHLALLIENNLPVTILKYEEFANDFDHLFSTLEAKFCFEIDIKDKEFLKMALSKKNVLKHIEQFETFAQWDQYVHFHGKHIDRDELSEEHKNQIRAQIISLLDGCSDLYGIWGYSL